MWRQLPLFQMELVLLYALAVITLWYAPLYGWLLLVSGWARRTTFLWAVLPLVAIGLVERITFHSSYFCSMLKDRLIGFAADAFVLHAPGSPPLDPHFYSAEPTYSGEISQQSGPVDRAGSSRRHASPRQSGCAVIGNQSDSMFRRTYAIRYPSYSANECTSLSPSAAIWQDILAQAMTGELIAAMNYTSLAEICDDPEK